MTLVICPMVGRLKAGALFFPSSRPISRPAFCPNCHVRLPRTEKNTCTLRTSPCITFAVSYWLEQGICSNLDSRAGEEDFTVTSRACIEFVAFSFFVSCYMFDFIAVGKVA